MRVALVHDYLKEFGGAERVLEVLSDIFPNAPIYTTLYCPSYFGPHKNRVQNKWSNRIHTSFFQFFPFKEKLLSPLRVLSPLAFKQFDFSKFDLIISSATGAYFPNSLNKKKAKLICYCHTPPRYLYGYPTARRISNPILLFLIDSLNHFLRFLDFEYAQNVDHYIANSQTVSQRISKFYRRSSVVINPPINLPKISKKAKRLGNYYLAGGRLAQSKRFDLALQACLELGLPLKIFGRDFANTEAQLKKIANNSSNVEFLGEITESQKENLFTQAKAFVNPGQDEDFGMLTVESMAFGCPVIGHNSGGSAETIVDGKTGILFDDLNITCLKKAIKRFQKTNFSHNQILSHSQQFSVSNFQKKFLAFVRQNSI